MKDEQNKITPLAVTNWRDIRKIFGIKEKNRRGHMYLIGKTGTGKSSLIANMAISDMRSGNGIGVIDPHGDLVQTLLSHVPKERIKDVVYFNPGDIEYPIAFNPLHKVSLDYQHLVVSGLISVFKKIWFEFWGPRLEHILRHSLLTLLEYPDATLLDIPKLLTNPVFRAKVLYKLTNHQVREFWVNEFDKYSAWLRSEAVSPILNKMGQFLTSLPLRNIVGQAESSFKMRSVMDEGKILLVNLSKGTIGEDNSSLLGSLLVTMIYLAALSRSNIPEEKRKSFYLYVDEFHNFVSLSFADILSESRKYGLHLVLAHQYISQLHEKVRGAVFGNVGTMISFRVGIEDAITLAREFRPVFDEQDLINLPNHHIYLKLMIDGMTSQPFSGVTLPLPTERLLDKKEIISESRSRYGETRSEVERSLVSKYISTYPKNNSQQSLFG
jgi:type IV secretory pathway TraG/TraD family ATPase VirD4